MGNNNLLGHLLNFKDDNGQHLRDDQISDNIIGVLFAAQGTTASALTWILKYLHDDPNLLADVKVDWSDLNPKIYNLLAEINSVFVL